MIDVTCRIVSGSATDTEDAGLRNFSTADAYSQPMLLTVAVVVPSAGGTATTRCKQDGSDNDVEVGHVHITAVQAGRLTRISLDQGGGTKTSGSSKAIPSITFASKTVATIPAGSTPTTIASLHLPQGAYTVMAKLELGPFQQGPTNGNAGCELDAGAATDHTGVDVDEGGDPGAVYNAEGEMALGHAFSDSSGGDVLVRCTSNRIKRNATNIRIVAIRAGRLVTVPLDGTSRPTFGPPSGVPKIVEAFAAGPLSIWGNNVPSTLIAKLHLPKGTWAVMIKLWANNVSGNDLGVSCDLSAGEKTNFFDEDLFNIQTFGGIDRMSIPLMAVPTFAKSKGGVVKLLCQTSGQNGDVQGHDLQIVAMKVGTIIREAI